MKTYGWHSLALLVIHGFLCAAPCPAQVGSGDTRVYARVTIKGTGSPVWLAVDWQVGGGSPRTAYASLGKQQLAAGVTPAPVDWIPPGGTSGWCDLTAALDHTAGSPPQYREHTVTFTLQGPGPLAPAELAVEWSREPNERGILARTTSTIDAPEASFLLSRTLAGVRTVRDLAKEHLAWARDLKLPLPAAGPLLFGSEVYPFPSPELAALETQTVALLGLNQVNSGYHTVPQAVLRGAKQAGVPNFQYLDFVSYTPQGAWQEIEGMLVDWAAKMRKESAALPNDLRGMVSCVKITDENYTVFPPPRAFANDAARREFWEWLRAKGMSPATFGKGRWEEVLIPVGNDYWQFASQARTRLSQPGDRLIWYWMLKFIHERTGRYYRRATELARALYGPQVLTKNTWTPVPLMGWGLAHWLNWFDYGRLEGSPLLLIDDWTSDEQIRTHNPYYADLLRAAARPRGLRFGFDAVTNVSDGDAMRRKIYVNAAHGVTYQDFYTYGPRCRTNEWQAFSENASIRQAIARCTRELAGLGPLLEGARYRSSGVALLYSVTNDVWWEEQGILERFGQYRMLLDGDTPPDIVSEADVAEGVLSSYRTLVLPSPCLTREAAAAIASWVRGGGRLVGVMPAGLSNEANAPLATLLDVWGITKAVPLKEGVLTSDAQQVGTLASAGNPVTLYGSRYGGVGGRARIARTFADGGPLLLAHDYGQGKALLFTANIGVSYVKGNAPEALRQVFLEAAGGNAAGIPDDERVICGGPDVQCTSLAKNNAVTVFLINYGKPLPRAHVEIRGVSNVATVRSILRGSVPFQTLNGLPGIAVDLALDVTDVLVVTQAARPASRDSHLATRSRRPPMRGPSGGARSARRRPFASRGSSGG